MSKTNSLVNETRYRIGSAAYGNTVFGYELFESRLDDESMRQYIPDESMFTSRLMDESQYGLYIDKHCMLKKMYHPHGTSESNRPHYVSRMFLYDDAFRKDKLSLYYDFLMETMDPFHGEHEIREQDYVTAMKRNMPAIKDWTQGKRLSKRESLLLVELLLTYHAGDHIEIVCTNCKSRLDKITEDSLIRLLLFVFPDRSISVNASDQCADLSFRCQKVTKLIDVSQIPDYFNKYKNINKVFSTLDDAASFINSVKTDAISSLEEIDLLAEKYRKKQELSRNGIRRMKEEQFYNINTVAMQFDSIGRTKESQELLLHELEQALEKGNITWKKNLEYIVGILTICFRYSEAEIAERLETMPIYPVLTYDAYKLMNWVKMHRPNQLNGLFVERNVRRMLMKYCAIVLEDTIGYED